MSFVGFCRELWKLRVVVGFFEFVVSWFVVRVVFGIFRFVVGVCSEGGFVEIVRLDWGLLSFLVVGYVFLG